MNINNEKKGYFIETKNNFAIVTRKNINNIQIYDVQKGLFDFNTYTKFCYKEENGKDRFGWEGYLGEDNLNLSKDIKRCHKAMTFIESLYFYYKVKYLTFLFNEINDIIRNICLVYFERTLLNIYNIRCKLI